MNDSDKETIVRDCAYGFVFFFLVMMLISAFFGKEYGRWFALTVMPLYALFYIIFYRAVCKSYECETKRLKAFGVLARGTFVGLVYYLSIFWVVMVGWLFGGWIYGVAVGF